jgi:hypothetical protein
MGAMLVPAMIGAGVGALGGAVTGQSPFKTALLGAGLGAGGAGLLGAGGAAGASSAAIPGAIGTTGEIGGANLIGSGISGGAGLGTAASQTMPSLFTNAASAGGGVPTSFMGNLGNAFSNLSTMDKINLGMKGLDIANQPQQQMQTPPLMPIRPGNPELVSTPLMNVAPNVGLQPGNKIGLPNLSTKIPLSDADILRLQMLAQQGIRG